MGEQVQAPPLPPPWQDLDTLLQPVLSQWLPQTRGRPAAAQRCLGLLEEHLGELEIVLERDPSGPGFGELWRALESQDASRIYGALPEGERAALSPDPSPAQLATLLQRGRGLARRQVAEWERARVERELPRVLERVQRQVLGLGRLSQALALGLGQLGRGSDHSPGVWQEAGLEGLSQAADLLRDNPSILALAERIGRRRGEGRGQHPGPAPLRAGPSEIRGLELGRDLSRVLACELALLADPELEELFWLRLSRGALMQLEVDQELRLSQDPERVAVGQDQGPILLLLDTSGSMRGEPERLSKALTLALLRVALLAGRRCVLVAFGSGRQLQSAELSSLPAALEPLMELLSGRFAGGTDPAAALEHALELGEPGADLLLVSDGRFQASPELRVRIDTAQRRRGLRVHVLLVGGGPRLGLGREWRWLGSLGQGEARELSEVTPPQAAS